MILALPWMLLAAPLIILLFLLPRQRRSDPLPIPSAEIVQNIPRSWRLRVRTPLLGMLWLLTVCCLSIAAARPQRVSSIPGIQEARNLIVALDLSRSMETPDFNLDGLRATRLDGVKSVVEDLLRERSADRVGLVVFGVQAFLQSPLTFDHALISRMVRSLRCGVAGDGTAIGDGLGLSIKRLQKKSERSRAIILITDGVNNSGNVNPLKAAQVARDLHIKIHTIGIGSTETLPQQLMGQFFQNAAPATAEFDEKLLREISSLTGGSYSAAGSSEDLRKIYDQIEQLDRDQDQSVTLQETEELFVPFAAAATLLYLTALLLGRTLFLKVPVYE